MKKTAARKAYDKLTDEFARLNQLEDACATVEEYDALKLAQRTERDSIHAKLENLRRWL